MVRTIPQINKELKYLEYAYQRLQIKTIQYREEKRKLEEEKAKLVALSDKKYAEVERKAPKLKKSSLSNKINRPSKSGIVDDGKVIVGEDNDEYNGN